MNKTTIPRRGFMKATAALAYGATYVNVEEALNAQGRRISFEQTKISRSIRQQYLNQLAERVFGINERRVINQVIYDHSPNLAVKAELDFFFRMAYSTKDEVIRESLINTRKDPRSKKYSDAVLIADAERQFQEDVKRRAEEKRPAILRNYSTAGATTVLMPNGKSNIYAFDRLFTMATSRDAFDFYAPPSEERVIGALWHEKIHGDVLKSGIHKNKLAVSPNTLLNMSGELSLFAQETEAHTGTLDYAQANKFSWEGYFEQILFFSDKVYKYTFNPETKINPRNYSGLERQLYYYEIAVIDHAKKKHPAAAYVTSQFALP